MARELTQVALNGRRGDSPYSTDSITPLTTILQRAPSHQHLLSCHSTQIKKHHMQSHSSDVILTERFALALIFFTLIKREHVTRGQRRSRYFAFNREKKMKTSIRAHLQIHSAACLLIPN